MESISPITVYVLMVHIYHAFIRYQQQFIFVSVPVIQHLVFYSTCLHHKKPPINLNYRGWELYLGSAD